MLWSLLSSKKKYCLPINKFGFVDEHKTFKGFTNVSDKLGRKEFFNMANRCKLIAEIPLSWRKSFSQGVVIPHKIKNCFDCKKDFLCDNCDKLVNQRKEFSANLNELKRQPPNECGHMPLSIKQFDDKRCYENYNKYKPWDLM